MNSSHHTVYPSLKDKKVFVTGGATGIGAAIVESFAQQGAHVAFVDVATTQAEALAQKISDSGCPAVWWRSCDVRDIPRLQQTMAQAVSDCGDFHALVNNVARDDRHAIEEVSLAYWDERMAVNQRPAFFAIQALIPGMRRLGGGSIVNLGSTGWQVKAGGFPCYSVAKSSVNGLTRGLASPLGKDRIRINTVSPGWVMTERQIQLWLDEQGEQQIQQNQCLPDKLQPIDIARMVLFLASDDASMCTAQEFKVDAGWN